LIEEISCILDKLYPPHLPPGIVSLDRSQLKRDREDGGEENLNVKKMRAEFSEEERYKELMHGMKVAVANGFDIDIDDFMFSFNTQSGNNAWIYLSISNLEILELIERNQWEEAFDKSWGLLHAYSSFDDWWVDNEVYTEKSLFKNVLGSFGNIWKNLFRRTNDELRINQNIREATIDSLTEFQDSARSSKEEFYSSFIPTKMDDFDFLWE